jgi:uncharacterized protein YggE
MPPQSSPEPPKHRISLTFDLRIIVVLLLIVIAAMLVLWKPWDANPKSSDRTVSVTGEATVKAEPDEYIFSPSYTLISTDQMTQKSDEVITQLKKIGVKDSQIKNYSNSYGKCIDVCPLRPIGDGNSYTLNLTITLNNSQLAQKVQDYLLTTKPEGSLTPQYNFSQTKRKQLESQARDQATKEARTKADQQAKNLGFKIGKVKSVEDGSGFGYAYPLSSGALDSAQSSSAKQLTLQPGENELNYSVTVVYYIR